MRIGFAAGLAEWSWPEHGLLEFEYASGQRPAEDRMCFSSVWLIQKCGFLLVSIQSHSKKTGFPFVSDVYVFILSKTTTRREMWDLNKRSFVSRCEGGDSSGLRIGTRRNSAMDFARICLRGERFCAGWSRIPHRAPSLCTRHQINQALLGHDLTSGACFSHCGFDVFQ